MPYGHNRQYRDLIREAEKKRLRITRQQRSEIAQIYTDIAADLDSSLKRHSPRSLSYRWVKDYAKALKKESRSAYNLIGKTIQRGILSTAEVMADTQRAYYTSLCPELSERFSAVFSAVPQRVVDELVSGGIYRDFTGLSERLWNYRGQFDRDIQYIINQGIIQKRSAYDLAKDLEIYLNPDAKRPFEWAKVYPGSNRVVDYSAQRLARTSVNHAYQMALTRSTRDNPFVDGYKWLSSNSARICEICRARNGKIYPKGRVPLDHPNGMCTIIAVISKSDEEITDELSAWARDGSDPKLDKWLSPDGDEAILEEPHKIFGEEKTLKNISGRMEIASVMDETGKVLYRKGGGPDSVSFSPQQRRELAGKIISHNHPSGGPLSPGDIYALWHAELREIRAVTPSGVFAVERPEIWDVQLDKQQLAQDYRQISAGIAKRIWKSKVSGVLSAQEAEYIAECVTMRRLARKYGLRLHLLRW